MNKKATLAIAVLMVAAAMICCFPAVDESSADDSGYGEEYRITIAPGMRYVYTPTYPSDLTVTTTIHLQKSDSVDGSDVTIASMSAGTLTVDIPASATAGSSYHVVLLAVSENPHQQAYIHIVFDIIANLTVSGSHPNIVVGESVDMTPVSSGMGTLTWTVTSDHTLPEGLSLDANTGRVTGTVSSIGTCILYLTCTSSYGEVSDLVVTFGVVSPLAPTSAPTAGVIIYAV